MSTVDESEIRYLLARERFYRDTGEWQKFRDCYHPDDSKTRIHIMWVAHRYDGGVDGFTAASAKLHTSTVSIVHNIVPVEIDVRKDKALALSWIIISTRVERPDGSEYDSQTYLRSFSQCEKVDGHWKLLTLEPIYVRDLVTPVPPGEPIDFGDLSKFRKSYRFTAWMVAQRGLTIRDDLPGSDDPATMAELVDRNRAWIAQS